MKFNNIAVIGLGLIGGSLCRALKDSGRVEKVIGIDSDKSVIDYALYNEIIDGGTTSFMRGLGDSEIAVICTHVKSIPGVAEDIYTLLPDGCILTDVGSVKEKIVSDVESSLPDNLFYVGGHPIAGTENCGISNSDKALFRDKKVFLTPTSSTDSKALEKISNMWETVGSNIFTLSPGLHDSIFSLVSHLPHVVAYSLVNSVLMNSEVDDIFEYAGGGLRDYTRVASSSPEMWKEIFVMNRENVLHAIRGFKNSIEEIESAIESGDEKRLLAHLSRAAKANREDKDR